MTRLRLWLARLLLPRGYRVAWEWDDALDIGYIAWLKKRVYYEESPK